jgi:DNA-binding NarL/FixJ family response regulator
MEVADGEREPADRPDAGRGWFTDSEWNEFLKSLHLPPRQATVLRLIFEGQRDRAIANKLDIKLSTVRVHVGRLLHRFESPDRVNLVIEVFRRFRAWQRCDSGPGCSC